MTGSLIAALVVVLAITSYLSALNLALTVASRSALERRLATSGRLSARAWVLDRLAESAHAVALFRTAGRVTSFSLILIAYAGFGEDASLTAGTLGATVATSVIVVWFTTSAIAAAVARHVPNGLIASSVPLLRVLNLLAWPFLTLVDIVDEAVRRLSGADDREDIEAEDDLLLTIEDSRKDGDLDPLSARILENVVEFRSTTVSSVMTPRTNIIGLEYTDDLDRIRAFLADAGHSRVPVYDESLDSIMGVLYAKDLVRYLGTDAPEFRLKPLLREPIRVPESKPVRELLLEFQHAEVHLAIVVDEYGGTSGLATIEDVLEEIVGEINDEHDVDSDEGLDLKPLGPDRWEFSGRYRVDDINAALELGIPEDDDYDTVAGFLLKSFGRIPRTGETYRYDNGDASASFEVAAATPTQIVLVRVTRHAGTPGAEAEGAAAANS
ncbi:MAG: HlyC/CorC family transporter [Phycisphaerae bacterium]|nr:HlyC/CorC family transporter [Phycisphaerae bacterium]